MMVRALLTSLLLAAGSISALAADGVSTNIDREIIEAGRAIMEQAQQESLESMIGSKNPYADDYNALAKDIMSGSRQHAVPFDIPDPMADDEKIYVFVSYSLGEEALKTIMEEISGRSDVVAVMRGIPEGMSLAKGLLKMRMIAGKVKPTPNVMLHPRVFEKFAVETVPAVAYSGSKGNLKVQGVVNIDWFKNQLSKGNTGDLGKRGEVREIDEPNIIRMMQRRAAQLDLKERLKASVDTYWDRVAFTDLSETRKYRRREVDPSIVGVKDLRTPDGKVFLRKGQRVNPLERMPFTSTLFVFDATQKRHVELVQKWKAERPEFSRVMLIATRLPRDDGWEELKKLEESMQSPVYLLNTQLAQRFGLEYAPAKVYADNDKKVFVVEEFPAKLNAEIDG